MVYTKWILEHTPFIDNKWDSVNTTTLDNFYNPMAQLKIGEGRDTFSCNFTDVFQQFEDRFNVNDKIVIRRAINQEVDTEDDSNILMVITLKDIPLQESGRKDLLKISGNNYSESIMGAIGFVDISGLSIPDGLKEALENVGRRNPNFETRWHPDNKTVRIDGSPFPTINSGYYFYKPVIKLIEEWSSKQKTGDTDYYWYVDNDNKFVWRAKEGNIAHSFNASTDLYESISVKKDLSKVKNFFIMKGGFDTEGHQIQIPYRNYASISAVGTKYLYFVSKANNAQDLIQLDLKSSGADTNARYPTFPFTTTWVSSITGTHTTIDEGSADANEQKYIKTLRDHIKYELKAEAERLARDLQYGKIKLDIGFQVGMVNWGLGTNIECTIPEIRESSIVMRVVDIQYTDGKDTYTLEEDTGTIGVRKK